MGRKIRLGVLVPSSNTVVEPLTQLITSSINIPDAIISVHFSRFLVIEISQSSAALKQFDLKHILRAAELLADAKVDVIGWCGTSAGWLGFDRDVSICKAIHDATGIPATSSTLALNKLLGVFEIEEFGLITPYLAAMNEAIVQNYAGIGKRITHECHMDITENTAIGEVTEQELNEMMHKMVADGATAVTIFCTNLHAAQLVPEWEKKYPDVVVFDSVAAVISDMLKLASINPRNVKGWGRMFDTSFAAAWY